MTLSLEGRLDTMTAPNLEAKIKKSLDAIDTLTLDFSKLEYISSSRLRVLLSAHKLIVCVRGSNSRNGNFLCRSNVTEPRNARFIQFCFCYGINIFPMSVNTKNSILTAIWHFCATENYFIIRTR